MVSLAYGALWLFIFAVPWENLIVIPGFGTISKLLGMVAMACAVVAALASGRVRRWHLLHLAALVFVIWAGIGSFRTPGQSIWSLYRFGTYFQLFLVLWMVWELAPSVQRVRGLLMAYLLGAWVGSLATIMAYLTGDAGARRFVPAGYDANELGTILALALPMAWFLGLTFRQPILRWICRGYLPIGLLALGLTASRGAMLVAIVALLIVPVTMTRLSPAKMAGAILLLIASGAIAIANTPERALERLSTATSELQQGSLGGRGRIWKFGVFAFADKPLIGHGTASFKRIVRLRYGTSIVAHNTYLTVLVEQGIVGFLPWSMMFVAVFFQVWRLPPLERRFGLVLLAALGIAILPLTWDDKKPVWFILAVLAAYSEALLSGKVAAAPVRQQSPRGPTPIARQPLLRARPGSRPSATPTRTPFHDP